MRLHFDGDRTDSDPMLSYSQKLAPIRRGARVRGALRRGVVGVLTLSGIPRILVEHRIRRSLHVVGSSGDEDASSKKPHEIIISPRMCIYAHYDVGNDLSEHDTQFLEWILSKGIGLVVVSTASLDPSADNLKKLREQGVSVIVRENYGLDFASWQCGLDALGADLEKVEWIYLINSSLYGPVRTDVDIFSPPTSSTNVYGLTASREYTFHAHSYFLGFDRRAVQQPAFKTFFSSISTSESKWSVILNSELSWLRYFCRCDLTVGTLFEPPRKHTINPLTRQWLNLLDAGFPFIKKSLFIQNYDAVDLGDWQEEVERLAGKRFCDVIKRDVERRRLS